MADSPRKRYSRSPSPWEDKSRSRSRSPTRSQSRPRGRSRSRSHGRAEDTNPGNTLYVTGLSSRVTQRDLEEHFSKEGKVKSAFLVVEPRSRISRGFAFITMDSLEDANRCIKHLNQSVLEGRSITVEKSRRKRPRTPTPGHYLGLHQSARGDGYHGDRGSHRGRGDYGYRRSPRRSPYRGGRDYSYSGTVEKIDIGTFFYQCVYLLLHPTNEVVEASARCCSSFGYNSSSPYMPHMSILYADLTDEEKKKAQEKAYILDESIGNLSFQISRLALYKTDTEDKSLKSWEKIEEYNLS